MDYLLLKEKEIILNAANNEQAFSELYDYYFPRVYNYVFARVGKRGASDDITSGVFEKIIAKISTYKPECGRFSTWLFTITHARGTTGGTGRRTTRSLPSPAGCRRLPRTQPRPFRRGFAGARPRAG